ncbi:histidinol-phosphate transaminase [Acinetobacter sp. ESBL14]|uniref:histidinol-phosphate transaminase n=1 Tax=Acinetobacter sp. ESBL14 TaxID=3077329 RepID=UPI002FCB0E20
MSLQLTDIIEELIRPEVKQLPLYDAGYSPSIIKQRYHLASVAKLSNNENPLGISNKVIAFLADKIHTLGNYPDPYSRELCQQIAQHLAVCADNIIIGNGSENILELLCQSFLNPNDCVLTQAPCFGLHEIFPLMMGAKVHKIPSDEYAKIDIKPWLIALKQPIKMLLVSNPSNPMGNIFNCTQLSALIDNASDDTLLVIDEAYYEYAMEDTDYPDALELLRHKQRPWIVLRTFSKAYGLAGLRVGYGIASDQRIIQTLHKVRTPYNINYLAQEAAKLALLDQAHLNKSIHHAKTERDRLRNALIEKNYFVAPSHTNFLFINCFANTSMVIDQLAEQGIIVKGCKEAGYESFIRISIGLKHENTHFLVAFDQVMKNIKEIKKY